MNIIKIIRRIFNLNQIQLEVDGLLFNLDKGTVIADKISNTGSYEPWITKLIECLVMKGDTVVDVGANIGIHTLSLSKSVGPRGHVMAFEPVEYLFEQLKSNLHLNEIKNVDVFNVAIGEIDQIAEMNIIKEGDYDTGSSSLVKNEYIDSIKQNRINKVKTKVVKLDNFIKRYTDQVEFIKMDIEGYEYYALLGMEEIIKKNKPIMIIEYNLDRIDHIGLSNKDFKKILNSVYDCYEIDRNNEDKGIFGLIPFQFDRFKSFSTPGYKYVRTDLLCLPKSKNIPLPFMQN